MIVFHFSEICLKQGMVDGSASKPASGMCWDQCRVKDLDSENIFTHLNQPQHILDGPKTREEV